MAINNEIVKPKRKLSDVAKEVLAYCETEQAATDLKDAILSIGNPQLTIKILLQERRFKDKENRDYYSYYDYKDLKNFYDPIVKKWSDYSKEFIDFYRNEYYYSQGSINTTALKSFNRKAIAYDVNLRKFIAAERTYSNDILKVQDIHGEESLNVNCWNLLNLKDYSSLKSKYKQKEMNWFKFITGLEPIDGFVGDLLKEIQKNIKKSLKSFLEARSVDLCNYPSECYSKNELKQFIADDIFYNEKVLGSDGMLTSLLNSSHSNSYFKSILESMFDKEMMSGVNLLFTLRFDPNIKIKNFSELNDKEKSKIIYSSLSDFKTIPDFILDEFMTREYWVKAFTETTTYLLNNIISGNDPKEFLSNSKFRGKFSDEFIVINDKLVFVDYLKRHDPSEMTSSVFLTENEFSEFKSEVVPLLEQIKDKVLYKAPLNNFSIIKGEICDKSKLLIKLLMDNCDIATHSFVPYLQNMLGVIPNKFNLFFDGNLSEYSKEELLDFLAVDDIINFENLNILITESDCNINTTRIGYKYNSKIVKLLDQSEYDHFTLLADYGSGIRCPKFFDKIKIG
jgi:hypothetical protein